ncbi:MAG TPA: helicase-associated domain-containing protein [Ktedonobacteraceae bacterium]|nr:helicase-associated domain-containing protein [Ktedonobacteraceae bacterium]
MELSDLHLLQTVPPYHVQAMLKTRLTALSSASQNGNSAPDAASVNLDEIADYLFEPRACREVLRALDEAEACVLRELVGCGGRANSRDLALYLDSPGSPFASHIHAQEKSESFAVHASSTLTPRHAAGAPSLYPTPHPHGAFELALHHLLLLGLLFWGKQTNFVGRDYSSGVYDGVLIVPQTVMQCAKQELQLDDLPEAPRDEFPGESMHSLQRAIYLYWSMVAGARDGLPLVNSRLLSRTSLRQVLEQCASLSRFWSGLTMEQIHTEGDVPYLLFLRLLLMKLGLLVDRQGTLHAMPAQEFFALSLVERAWRCFHLWLETPFWNELGFIANVVTQPGPAPLDPAHEEVVRSRQLVVEHIIKAAPETWHALPTFIARMKLYATSLLFPRQYGLRAERYAMGSNPYGWNFRLRRGWLTHREGWHLVEGGFIRTLVTGPLYWLGMVELAEAEHPDAFRLASGARLVAGSSAPEVEETSWGRLVVQPNFDLVALAPVSEGLLVKLDRFAERVRLEHIAQYRLSKASITLAVQLGLTAEAIQQTLEEAAGGTIPQNVRYSLVEWERQARRIELWRGASLLEVDDPALLDALSDEPETSSWLLRRLAPTLAEVDSEHLAQLQEVLWQRDYLPALSSAAQYQDLLTSVPLPTREAQWNLLPDGLLQPCYPLTNLYLDSELERVTVEDALTGWRRITADSLKQALAAGFALDGIIRFLQNYCVGGIPGSFLIHLKLWGSGYAEPPDLQIETAPLLSLSAQALQDILTDEEIGPLLGTPVPEQKRLVRVPQENLEQVMELLKERGFECS